MAETSREAFSTLRLLDVRISDFDEMQAVTKKFH
jgi:hypothetical protein